MHDCIVVGAGFSGLSAATDLEAAGKSVVLIEARERVGGRTEPGTLAGHTIDLGGMWLGPTQTRLAKLADDFGVKTYPHPLEGRNHFALKGSRASSEGEAYEKTYSLFGQLELLRVIKKLNRLTDAVSVESPWSSRDAEQLDGMTLATWCDQHVRGARVRSLLDMVCRSVLCAEPGQVSMLFYLFYLKSGGGLEVLISMADGGAQNFLFHGGVHQIGARLADNLKSELRLGEPVTSIQHSDGSVTVRTEKGTYEARKIIMATPPGLTERIAFEPELPHAKRGLMQRQPMGMCIKVWIAYAKPFWRDAGLNALILDDAQPFTPIFDATPPGSKEGILAGFFDALPAAEWTDRSPEERKEQVINAIVDALGEEGKHPIDYAERDWSAERWSQGCYGGYMGPGTLTTFGHALRAPIGNIHWAGTETATEWTGYIEGAIQAGRRAAQEVIART